ncbi:MAG: aminotransferase class I/II-fold pyridoxal phosphate-dependent enzyme [Halioglobus sp.]|nr:aminotransferase class I/II-fold pyridoxal phosphate-dependent enzyme [Halioglobus sp.]
MQGIWQHVIRYCGRPAVVGGQHLTVYWFFVSIHPAPTSSRPPRGVSTAYLCSLIRLIQEFSSLAAADIGRAGILCCPAAPLLHRPREGNTVHIDRLSAAERATRLQDLQAQYRALHDQHLALDLTRGKPCDEQLTLSDALDGILGGDFRAADGTDARNYGGLEGLPEARALFAEVLDTPLEETFVGGNSSLTLMYGVIDFALTVGLSGPASAWGNEDSVKFLCPTPGYDRHFGICEHLGIEMIAVPMLDNGPDMDAVEARVRSDKTIKGMWCVPRFSNPTGCVYSEETVKRIAQLGLIAADHFLVMWDNAYAVHTLYDDAAKLPSLHRHCMEQGTLNNVFQFGSTSKVTFASAGIAFLSSGARNLEALQAHMAFQSIGPNKVEQLRHVRLLKDSDTLSQHMAAHAAIIRPRFECVLTTLDTALTGSGMGQWTRPKGGYFISFDTLPGLASRVVQLAAAIGVKLTPAGATFPYGKDPADRNIRLSPTFLSLDDLQTAMDAFVVCVQLASMEAR